MNKKLEEHFRKVLKKKDKRQLLDGRSFAGYDIGTAHPEDKLSNFAHDYSAKAIGVSRRAQGSNDPALHDHASKMHAVASQLHAQASDEAGDDLVSDYHRNASANHASMSKNHGAFTSGDDEQEEDDTGPSPSPESGEPSGGGSDTKA